MIEIPTAVYLAILSVIAAPVAAWSFKTVRQANRVVSLDGKRLDTIAAQAEYIEALEQKCKALETTLATREHEYGEAIRQANNRILKLEAALGTLEVWSEAKEKRATRTEARAVHAEARDDASVKRQSERADRSEAREIARDAHEGVTP
jgi:hypothetical protein